MIITLFVPVAETLMPPFVPVTSPAETVTFPPDEDASIPTPPVTEARSRVRAPPTDALTPALPPLTAPAALTDAVPAPLLKTAIPKLPATTDAAVIMIPNPLASFCARMPSPRTPVTGPLTLIEMAPPPLLVASIAVCPAVICLPVADWVKERPRFPPLCSSKNAVAPALTAVLVFSVTRSSVFPLAPRDWGEPICEPSHTTGRNETDPSEATAPILQSLVGNWTRSNTLLSFGLTSSL